MIVGRARSIWIWIGTVDRKLIDYLFDLRVIPRHGCNNVGKHTFPGASAHRLRR